MIFYYDLSDNRFRTYNTKTKEFETVNRLPYKDEYVYYVFKDAIYGGDDGMLKFIEDFDMWCKELKECTKIIDYKRFRCHQGAITLIVKKLCPHFDKFGEIDSIESKWLEKCSKSYLHTLTTKGIIDCYGYDFKAFYLSIMGMKDLNYDIPLHKGSEQCLKSLDFYKLDVGMYRVKITSSDKRFLFQYSKDNIYTNISLYYAFKCQRNGLNIDIELIQDDEPNAYIYGKTMKDGIHSSRYMFGNLYDTMMIAKQKYPKNKLVKFLCSSIWGHICEFNTKNLTMDEIIEKDLFVTKDANNLEADYYIRKFTGKYYELVDQKKIYKHNCARFKPFLLSMGRVISANVASLYIDDVVRIHTDGLVFSKQHDDIMTKFKSYPTLLPEAKTTGMIDWVHTNDYYNMTLDEKHGKYKSSMEVQLEQLQMFHKQLPTF